MFDTETSTWTSLRPMRTQRQYCATAVVENQVIVAGGNNGTHKSTAEALTVDIDLLFPRLPNEASCHVLGRLRHKKALEEWVDQVTKVTEKVLAKFETVAGLSKEYETGNPNTEQINKLEDLLSAWRCDVNDRLKDAKAQIKELERDLKEAPPCEICCPITEVVNDPVVVPDGNVHERSAMERVFSPAIWFRRCMLESQLTRSCVRVQVLQAHVSSGWCKFG
mmetsp:Transcript_5019/g.11265  ORF Transcript_5019/g.11265 Transcript_5019/m.11265 type:complete len:222 (-) Transcript_5019:70-735(-)